jgi:hypothetical protein
MLNNHYEKMLPFTLTFLEDRSQHDIYINVGLSSPFINKMTVTIYFRSQSKCLVGIGSIPIQPVRVYVLPRKLNIDKVHFWHRTNT